MMVQIANECCYVLGLDNLLWCGLDINLKSWAVGYQFMVHMCFVYLPQLVMV